MSDAAVTVIVFVLVGLAVSGLAASILIWRDKAAASKSGAKPVTFREQSSKQFEQIRKEFEQIRNFDVTDWLFIAALIFGIAFALYVLDLLDLPPGPWRYLS